MRTAKGVRRPDGSLIKFDAREYDLRKRFAKWAKQLLDGKTSTGLYNDKGKIADIGSDLMKIVFKIKEDDAGGV